MVKTITVTDQAYDHLKKLKTSDESFSQAIERIYLEKKSPNLDELVGTMSESDGTELDLAIKKGRNKFSRKF